MTTQMVLNISTVFNLFSLPLDLPEDEPQFSAVDYGYELREDEIVSGMLIQLPDRLTGQSIPEVEPEEFEAVYGWFLS